MSDDQNPSKEPNPNILQTIGCIITEFANPFYVPVVQAVEDLAEVNNHMVIIGETRRQIEVEKRTIARFRQLGVRGIIIRPVMSEIEHLMALERDGIPVIISGRSMTGFFCVNVNNGRSGYLAGKYLTRLGHRRIGYIYSGDPDSVVEMSRLSGFWNALSEVSLSVERVYTVGSIHIRAGENAAQQWLEDHDRPTAVFCSTDLLAMGFIQHLIREGISIPRDVSVIGHDDIPFADTFLVGITTVAFPKYTLGHVSTRLLFDRLLGKVGATKPEEFILEPELVERNSCAEFGTNKGK